MRVTSIAVATCAAALIAAGSAGAMGTKSVKDWTAVCDNVGACAAFGFSPETDENAAYLKITRQAGGAAAPSVVIVFDPGDQQPAQTWTLALDGKPVAGLGPLRAVGGASGARASLGGAAASALIAALRNGQSLSLVRGGQSVAEISLAGSAGALLWVDDQQGRVGTVSALGRPGPKPAAGVPPPPAPPLIAAAPPAPQGGLPKHAPKGLAKGDADCDLGASDTDPDDIVARLAPGVVLWGPECSMAAYNELNIFFVGDEHGGHLRRVILAEPAGSKPPTDDSLMNASFDAKTQTLSSFAKARGIGDCGSAASWVWDGRAFQLLSETIMPECRGVLPDDWPPLYVARRR